MAEIRQPQAALTHSLELQPRFGDYDMFGHINNNAYLQYFDLGKAMFFTELLDGDFSPAAVGAAVVHIDCNYYAPTRPAEPLRVLTGCVALGERSLTLHQQVVNPSTGAVKCDALTVMAGFDIRAQQSAPLPERLRSLLGALLRH